MCVLCDISLVFLPISSKFFAEKARVHVKKQIKVFMVQLGERESHISRSIQSTYIRTVSFQCLLSALLNQFELVYRVKDQVVHGAKASSNFGSNIKVAHVLILVSYPCSTENVILLLFRDLQKSSSIQQQYTYMLDHGPKICVIIGVNEWLDQTNQFMGCLGRAKVEKN